MPGRSRLVTFAHRIDPHRASVYSARMAERFDPNSPAFAYAVLLSSAYPALTATIESSPEIVATIAAEGHQGTRDHAGLAARLRARTSDDKDLDLVARELRRFAAEERLRVALRELLPLSLGGADVDVTAQEITALAEVTIDCALRAAKAHLAARFGVPQKENGSPARFVVIGMGKLGGNELNVGSDVDLIFFYDTDDGGCVLDGKPTLSLHDFWSRVAKRLTALIEDVTEDGWVWRVDLRLRPEGRSGPLVNSLAAVERYYESFGRTWERAALVRARPIAGDLDFGDEALAALEPFVWRRRVDPTIAIEMTKLVQRSRAELSTGSGRDLKLGPGGIREAEFFVQTLELIWGGREARLRARGTLDGLRRLRSAGLVTDREAREIADAYLTFRRAEHAVQFATGQQTHSWPSDDESAGRLARALGFSGAEAFDADIERHLSRVTLRFRSLVPEGAPDPSRWTEAIAALDDGNAAAFEAAWRRASIQSDPAFVPDALERSADVARDLFEMSRRPDAVLGARSRETYPLLADALLDAVADAAAPELAARTLRMVFMRLRQPGVYLKFVGHEPRAIRRLVEAIGGSAFVGEALVRNPELGDRIWFSRGVPTTRSVHVELVEAEREPSTDEDPEEVLVGALRRTKARVVLDVGLADLASEISPREVGHILSELADVSLQAATRHALGTPKNEPVQGLCVLAVGTLGGREIGYGSDLDVLFLFDPSKAPEGADPHTYFARCARRVITLISVLHPAGPGYELDTRLRPSGNQGLLVTSIDAFARYHGQSIRGDSRPTSDAEAHRIEAAVWERLALLRARVAAGDTDLGKRAMKVAHAAAYVMVGDPTNVAEELRRIRRRMEVELSQERRGRFDLKFGHGGLFEIDLCVQFLQMLHGADVRVRTTETARAIELLANAGYLAPDRAEVLRDGHAFLRKLQGRIRIVHGDASSLVEETAPGLLPLARRMGIRDRPGALATHELLARYREVTSRVRQVYEATLKGS
jgi:glutamate-ammonia-ligase adenylyltransferase